MKGYPYLEEERKERTGVGLESRRPHVVAVHVVLETESRDTSRGHGLRHVEVLARIVWRRSLAIRVVGADGRALGSGYIYIYIVLFCFALFCCFLIYKSTSFVFS